LIDSRGVQRHRFSFRACVASNIMDRWWWIFCDGLEISDSGLSEGSILAFDLGDWESTRKISVKFIIRSRIEWM